MKTNTLDRVLAIVIPAYKSKYLSETLDSIAAQTDQRFCVYIGDDKSPENIEVIVKQYEGEINLVYKRFEDNLGGKDLVAQWERCINMTQGEEWIWLFSDDDYMDSTCVEAFYTELEKGKGNVNTDLFRFNLNITNNKEIKETPIFPRVVTPQYLFKKKMSGKSPVFAVEYIFSRRIHEQQGGFQNFDLAWHSDIATWMKFGVNGIVTIPGPEITWRSSGENITTLNDENVTKRKWKATVSFFVWVRNFLNNSIHLKLYTDFSFLRVFHGTVRYLNSQYCINTAKEYLGNGMRSFFLLNILKLHDYLTNAF